jgi:epoxyqueuosine reductase QueG
MTDQLFTTQMKSLAVSLGADLVGIASAARYAEAPIEMSPQGHLPGATCVLVVAIHHPDAAIEIGGNEHPQKMGPYFVQGVMNTKLECISFQIARKLEDLGHRVVAIPATNVWRFRPYKNVEESFAPDLSDIHAAAAAGLGEIGYNGLLLTPEYGPRQRFCCLVTDAPLVPDPLYDGEPLCDMCGECIRHCPMDVFNKETGPKHVIHMEWKEFSYCNKNKWRCSWAEHFGLDLDAEIPEQISEQAILDNLEIAGRRGGAMGSCLRYCLPAHLRFKDPDYTTTWRRRRPFMDERPLAEQLNDVPMRPDRTVTLNVIKRLIEREVDMLAIVDRQTALQRGFDLRDELPDARTLIAFAHHCPPSMEDPAATQLRSRPQPVVAQTVSEWSGFAQLELCQYLEARGYSAMPGGHLGDAKIIPAAGFAQDSSQNTGPVVEGFDGSLTFGCVLTSAPLRPATHLFPIPDTVRPVPASDLRLLLDAHARKLGADLFGVAAPDLVSALATDYRQHVNEADMQWAVRDTGGYHGTVKPVIDRCEERHIRTADELLPGARAVLAIGYHFPFLNILNAAEPPTDAVGPYSYAVYQANRWLRYIGVSVAKMLVRLGCRAVVSQDLSDSGTLVANPRGFQPDALANRFAAAAAGLAHIGIHGAPITPQFGVTQRFITIVTDADLPADKPLSTPAPCADCDRACLSACPVKALVDATIPISSDGFSAELAEWDRVRCEWAKRYAMVGEEGPMWGGQTTDIMPPEGDITPEVLAEAYRDKDPIQKHFTMILEPCLKACQLRLSAR